VGGVGGVGGGCGARDRRGSVHRLNSNERRAAGGGTGDVDLSGAWLGLARVKLEVLVWRLWLELSRLHVRVERTAWWGSQAPVMPIAPLNSGNARARTTAAGGGVVQGFWTGDSRFRWAGFACLACTEDEDAGGRGMEVELIFGFDEDWVCSNCDAGARGLLARPCFIIKGWGWGWGSG
jgi:hypothetical protein